MKITTLAFLLFPFVLKAQPLPQNASCPQWPKPLPPKIVSGAPAITSQPLELVHATDTLGGFVLKVGGQAVGFGQTRPLAGYLVNGQLRWLDFAEAAGSKTLARRRGGAIQVSFSCADSEGGHWSIQQEFRPAAIKGAIDVRTEIKIDQDRAIAFLPVLTILPGANSFGEHKTQGLFAGLEYLADEPSSSEADVIGPASKRTVPDNLKITFPLMAINHQGRYLALSWNSHPDLSALFDSPDRLFGSGGHVMGLLFPGSNGKDRIEGSLLPREAKLVVANQALVFEATIMGGVGQSVVPAVQQYVALRGLPPPPSPALNLQAYTRLAAGGWLDSKIREGELFRHAAWQGFGPARAADALVFMDWLANTTGDPALRQRLTETAAVARAKIAGPDLNAASISHIRYPLAALVYGSVPENAARAGESARHALAGFAQDGSMRYHPKPGGPDYAKTHFTNEASGLTATAVENLLESAVFSGDQKLIASGLARLRDMNKFRNGEPRGAQTWECPLHTPDILASAHLVRAYTLGYELTGERSFLEEALYWAWTGVPFVYLTDPVAKPIGRYATIAVFGATAWKAPVWLGLPVQWCGLVYADALYRLARHDPNGPWKQLADGITISGIQQTWPQTDHDRQGLLPDSFVLRSQERAGPPINPGTVQACASHLFDRPLYDFWTSRRHGLMVHTPGRLEDTEENGRGVSFIVDSWRSEPVFVLIYGLAHEPRVTINGQPQSRLQFAADSGRLILRIKAKSEIQLGL